MKRDYEQMSLHNHVIIKCEFLEDWPDPTHIHGGYKKGDLVEVKDFGDEWFELVAIPFDYRVYPKHILKPIGTNLTKEISEMQSYELFGAFEEIAKFKGSGILIDGAVKKIAQKIAEENNEDMIMYIKLVIDTFLFEMARRYYEGMRI